MGTESGVSGEGESSKWMAERRSQLGFRGLGTREASELWIWFRSHLELWV